MYGGLADLDAATVEIPLVLFQAQQIVCGQITVEVLKRWMKRIKERDVAEETGGPADEEKGARVARLEAEERDLAEEATLRETSTEGEVETEKGKRERLDREA